MQGVIPNADRDCDDRSKGWPRNEGSVSPLTILGDYHGCNTSATRRAADQGKSRFAYVSGGSLDQDAAVVKFITDTATGAFVEVQQVLDAEAGTVTYYDATGAVRPLVAGEVVLDYVMPKLTGQEPLSVTDGAFSGLISIPANTTYAIFQVQTTDALWTVHSAAPTLTNGWITEVGDLGRLEVLSDIEGFRLAVSGGAGTTSIVVWYYNVKPDPQRT